MEVWAPPVEEVTLRPGVRACEVFHVTHAGVLKLLT